MNLIKQIGHVKMPKGTGALIKSVKQEFMPIVMRRGMAQIHHGNYWGRKDIALFSKLLPSASDGHLSMLLFTYVEAHSDDWDKVLHKARSVAPAFVHVVVSGKAKIWAGTGSKAKVLKVQRGDVFALNPNVTHGVNSNSLCITACVTVPALTVF